MGINSFFVAKFISNAILSALLHLSGSFEEEMMRVNHYV
jgi:hypothetical protein